MFQIEIRGVDGEFESAAVDAYYPAWSCRGGCGEEREEVLDEAHSGVVAEGEEVVYSFDCF